MKIRLNYVLLNNQKENRLVTDHVISLRSVLETARRKFNKPKLQSIYKSPTEELTTHDELKALKNGATIYFSQEANHWVTSDFRQESLSLSNDASIMVKNNQVDNGPTCEEDYSDCDAALIEYENSSVNANPPTVFTSWGPSGHCELSSDTEANENGALAFNDGDFELSRHCWSRIIERKLSKVEIDKTIMRGKKTSEDDVCRYEYKGIVCITDKTSKNVITAWKTGPGFSGTSMDEWNDDLRELSEKGTEIELVRPVPDHRMAALIGKGGEVIRGIRSRSAAKASIQNGFVYVAGSWLAIQHAMIYIDDVVNNNAKRTRSECCNGEVVEEVPCPYETSITIRCDDLQFAFRLKYITYSEQKEMFILSGFPGNVRAAIRNLNKIIYAGGDPETVFPVAIVPCPNLTVFEDVVQHIDKVKEIPVFRPECGVVLTHDRENLQFEIRTASRRNKQLAKKHLENYIVQRLKQV
jgi:hypothetical protein